MRVSTRRGLLAGAAALTAAPALATSRQPHPDAELLALAAEIKRSRTEAEQMHDSVEHLDLDDPRSIAVWDAIHNIVERGHEKTATLAIMPSRTMEGLKAKAALAFEHLDTTLDGSPPHGEALEWSVCRDLLAGSAS